MKTLTTLCLLFISMCLNGQNLVINGSFEDTLCSPQQFNVFSPFSAENWYSPTTGTPDYLGSSSALPNCYFSNVNDPGFTQFGDWQLPQNGERMSGIYCHADDFCLREYVQARLDEPLDAGKRYCLTFYVSLRNTSNRAIDQIGAVFTNDSIVDFTGTCIDYLEPQIESAPGFALADTANWMLIIGDFIAEGGESFITIGNFTPQNEQFSIPMNGFGAIAAAYYYVDNVVLENCFATSIAEIEELNFRFFPNPASSQLQIQSNQNGNLIIRDVTGRVVLTHFIQAGGHNLTLSHLVSGMFLLEFEGENGGVKSSKLVID